MSVFDEGGYLSNIFTGGEETDLSEPENDVRTPEIGRKSREKWHTPICPALKAKEGRFVGVLDRTHSQSAVFKSRSQ